MADITNQQRLKTAQDKANEVFNSEHLASRWMIAPNKLLKGVTPIDALTTDSGLDSVLRILTSIEYGHVA